MLGGLPLSVSEAATSPGVRGLNDIIIYKNKKLCHIGQSFLEPYARSIFPERRQREQTATVVLLPLTTALTLRMLGFQVLFVLRLE